MKMDDTIQHYKVPKNFLGVESLTVWSMPLEVFEVVGGEAGNIKTRWFHHIHIPLPQHQTIEITSDKIEYRVNGVIYNQIEIPIQKNV